MMAEFATFKERIRTLLPQMLQMEKQMFPLLIEKGCCFYELMVKSNSHILDKIKMVAPWVDIAEDQLLERYGAQLEGALKMTVEAYR